MVRDFSQNSPYMNRKLTSEWCHKSGKANILSNTKDTSELWEFLSLRQGHTGPELQVLLHEDSDQDPLRTWNLGH